MMQQSEGIVLGSISYNDKKKIVKIFTKSEGIQGFAISRSNKSGKTRNKEALLRPLQMIGMHFQPAQHNKIGKLGEIEPLLSPEQIYTSSDKRLTGLFLTEFLTRVLHNHGPDEEVYVYIAHALQALETSAGNNPDFILSFLSGLAMQMGIFPENNYGTEQVYFDAAEGKFVNQFQSGKTTLLDFQQSEYMHLWLHEFTEGNKQLNKNGQIRGQLTDTWLLFFRLHIPGMRELHAPEYIREMIY